MDLEVTVQRLSSETASLYKFKHELEGKLKVEEDKLRSILVTMNALLQTQDDAINELQVLLKISLGVSCVAVILAIYAII